MNITDLILFALLFLFGLRGYFRGLFRESFSLLGLSVGLMVAIRFDDPLAALWSSSWAVPHVAVRAISFAALFCAVYFGFGLAGWLLHQYSKRLFLGTVDRVGGLLLSLGKGTLVLSLIIFFLVSSSILSDDLKRKIDGSYVATVLSTLGRELYKAGRGRLLTSVDAQAQTGEGPP